MTNLEQIAYANQNAISGKELDRESIIRFRKRWSKVTSKVNFPGRVTRNRHISDVTESVKDVQQCEKDWLEKAMSTIHC